MSSFEKTDQPPAYTMDVNDEPSFNNNELEAASCIAYDPPSYYEAAKLSEPIKLAPFETSQLELNEIEIRNVFKKYAARKLAIQFSSIDKMVYTKIEHQKAYVYKINSLKEERRLHMKTRPHSSSIPIDGPINKLDDVPTDLWKVTIQRPSEFVSGKSPFVKVEHTEVKRQCHSCKGSGTGTCISCGGLGVRMSFDGKNLNTTICIGCGGSGKRVCPPCAGSGEVVEYQTVQATWKALLNQLVASPVSILNEKQLNSNLGVPLLNVTDDCVKSFTKLDIQNESIIEFSQRTLAEITKENDGSKLIKLNHSIYVIPVTTVEFTINGDIGIFHIYGTSYKVKIDSYPSKTCCIS